MHTADIHVHAYTIIKLHMHTYIHPYIHTKLNLNNCNSCEAIKQKGVKDNIKNERVGNIADDNVCNSDRYIKIDEFKSTYYSTTIQTIIKKLQTFVCPKHLSSS